ncbi:MAG: alpha-N-acetylglucosaminidase N-terminal domain-containing protein [Bacteroides xylanisolvens]
MEGKIVIRGNSANSMAVGLNHYLKYYCKTSILEYLNDPVEL